MTEKAARLKVKKYKSKYGINEGDLVLVAKDLPSYMSHFESGFYAIVMERSGEDYMLKPLNDINNIMGWYTKELLSLIKE